MRENINTKINKDEYFFASTFAIKAIKKVKGSLFLCDQCKGSFKPEETLMVALPDTHPDVAIAKQKGITLRGKQVGGKQYYFVSPCCYEPHVAGFSLTSKDEPHVESVA